MFSKIALDQPVLTQFSFIGLVLATHTKLPGLSTASWRRGALGEGMGQLSLPQPEPDACTPSAVHVAPGWGRP